MFDKPFGANYDQVYSNWSNNFFANNFAQYIVFNILYLYYIILYYIISHSSMLHPFIKCTSMKI